MTLSAHPHTPYRFPMAAPDLRGNELLYVSRAMVKNQLTQGEYVARFEQAFAARLGVKHAVSCSSGTAALHLALLAAGVEPGDRVLVPTLTYVATAAAIRYCGAIPVFGDADPETWSLNGAPNGFAELKTVVTVDLYGVPAIPVPRSATPGDWIEDACEALGATVRVPEDYPIPDHAGTRGTCGVFSFYGNKILTTGEGGMVVTDDDALAAEVTLLRGQGQSPTRRYWHTVVGYNYRMTELSAAIGCAQLERLDEMLGKRHALHERYVQNLRHSVELQRPRLGTTAAPWVFACLLPSTKSGDPAVFDRAYRDKVMAVLAKEHGIETRPTFPCVHQMPPYERYAWLGSSEDAKGAIHDRFQVFPVAEDIARRGLLLPLHSQMNVDQVDVICDALRRLL